MLFLMIIAVLFLCIGMKCLKLSAKTFLRALGLFIFWD